MQFQESRGSKIMLTADQKSAAALITLGVITAMSLYIALSFAFIFAPIAASFVFSLNVDRFPSLPLGATYNANIDRGLALFDRDGIYGPSPHHEYEDNVRRFSVLSKAALALPGALDWMPHIVHAHDWQHRKISWSHQGLRSVLDRSLCHRLDHRGGTKPA